MKTKKEVRKIFKVLNIKNPSCSDAEEVYKIIKECYNIGYNEGFEDGLEDEQADRVLEQELNILALMGNRSNKTKIL